MANVVKDVLSCHPRKGDPDLEEILKADLWARDIARKTIERMRIPSC